MNKRNEFDDPDTGFGFLGAVGPKAAFFIVLIALSFMIGLVWKLYTGGGSSDPEQVPIIRADADGFKVEPDDRGGMEIKFQDSTLFNADDPDATIENLLAEDTTESPMPRSQLFAGLSTEEGDMDGVAIDEQRIVEQTQEAEKIVEDLVENGADAMVVTTEDGNAEIVVMQEKSSKPIEILEEKAPEIKFDAEPLIETQIDTKKIEAKIEPPKVNVPKVEPKPVVTEKPKAEPVAAPTAQPVASGDYFVQLASVKSESAAKSEWDNFVKKYSPLLNGVSHRVEKADLGAKGIFYRIQAGPIAKSNADNICGGIKSKGGSCLVKKK